MTVKGKAVEVGAVAVVVAAVAVGGRKLWLGICRRENLKAIGLAAAGMAMAAIVVIPPLVVMAEGLVMVSRQL